MEEQKKQFDKEEQFIEKKEAVVQKEFKEFWEVAIDFIKALFNIRKNADKEFTKQTILENIPFRGHTAWLLIFSVMIASVGLNANSTPVVIGAMLISPLMGPIMGAGFAIGTNDIDTFKKSALNFLVMVTLSIITSYLYFKISPLAYASSELLSRTSPTFFDVLIAFFGGLAGIVALTKRGFFNVISGVAIATALMPPLCTAGFGLATGNIHFFTGAMYLLLINSFFIALATFLVIKYLHFPVAHYLNSAKRRRISRIIYILALLVMIPSIISFITMYQNEVFKRSATAFVQQYIKYEGAQVLKTNVDPDHKRIEVYLIGEVVPPDVIKTWQKTLHQNPTFKNAELYVYQSADKTKEIEQSLSEKLRQQILDKLFKENKEAIKNKDEQIKGLTDEIIKLKQSQQLLSVSFNAFAKETKTLFPYIKTIGYGKVIETNFKTTDTLPELMVSWSKKLSYYKRRALQKKLQQWAKERLQLDTLKVISIP